MLQSQVGRRHLLILLASLLVLVYAAGVLGYVLTTPEIGVRTAFSPVVNHFFLEFLYPKDQERLREGDLIVQVADQPVSNWSQLLRRLVELYDRQPRPITSDEYRALRAAQALRDARDVSSADTHLLLDGQEIVRVVYERGGGECIVWCRYGRSPVETVLPSVLWFFLKIGLFAVGAVVFWKRPTDRPAAQFFLFCTLSFGAYLGGYHWARIVTQPVLLVVFMCCAVLLPAVSLHFYLLFPRPKALLQRWPWTLRLAIYGPATLFLILLLTNYLRVRLYYPHDVTPLLDEMRVETLLYFGIAALWYLLSVVSQVHSYLHAIGATERNQVKWILYGTLASLAPIGYSLYLALFEGARFSGGGAIWPMFAASACVTVAYTVSITRYRLMQLDQIVSSGFGYMVVIALLACVYYGLLFAAVLVIGSRGGEGPSLGQAIGVAAVVSVLMVALDQARGRVRAALDRHFRREKHQLDRTWQRMSEAIEQLVDPPTLARRLLHTAADLLGTPSGAVYLRQGPVPLYLLTDHLGASPALVELSSGCPLVEALKDGAAVLARDPEMGEAARRQLRFLQGEVAHALWHEGQLLGLLLLGAKHTGTYSPEDQQLLTAFAQLTVLALVSAEGRRSIEGLNRELQAKVEKIAEQQRRILALQSQLQRGARAADREAAVGDREANGPIYGAEAEVAGGTTVGGARGPLPAPPSLSMDGLVGSGPQVAQLLQLIRKVAVSESAVLLRGESGTGKELLARALHDHSPRAGKAFVKVHCAALSPGLLESELFGHVKGAFTNAIRDKVGRFEAANGGTLFLDEIGDVSLDVQIKLLRVLQEKIFERVGSSEPVKVDVRIIAATHQDLELLMREGRFRDDLFYRLNVLPIRVPPLRERIEDVPELALHFLQLYAQRTGKPLAGFDDDALALLKAYSWPGNIRELENVIERAVVIADGALLTPAELPAELQADADAAAERDGDGNGWPASTDGGLPAVSFRSERERREREHLVRALAAAAGNKTEAARALGLARSTFLSRLKRLGLG